jgi:hypothetical protein
LGVFGGGGGETCASGVPAGTSLKQMMIVVKTKMRERKKKELSVCLQCRSV